MKQVIICFIVVEEKGIARKGNCEVHLRANKQDVLEIALGKVGINE